VGRTLSKQSRIYAAFVNTFDSAYTTTASDDEKWTVNSEFFFQRPLSADVAKNNRRAKAHGQIIIS